MTAPTWKRVTNEARAVFNPVCTAGLPGGGDCKAPATRAWSWDGSPLCWSCEEEEHFPKVMSAEEFFNRNKGQ